MRTAPLLIVPALALAFVAPACGGATSSDLFSGGPSPSVDAGADVGLDATSGRDAAQIADAVGPPEDVAPPPPFDARPPPPKDASPPPPVDSGPPPVDAGGGDPGIRCGDGAGAAQCTPGQDVCCRTAGTNLCQPAGACLGLAIPCDDTADCELAGQPGDVCCVTVDNQGRASSIACVSAASCAQQGKTNMCDPAVANPCPNGGNCRQSQTSIPPYYICK